MNYKENRTVSFIIVSAVYAVATVTGVVSYLLLPFSYWINLLIADVAATVVTFIFSVIFGNASVYDPYWSVQPIVIITAFFVVNGISAAGVLLLISVFFWGIRLTANWAYTFHGLYSQDWRYTMLKEKSGKLYPIVNFFGIHMFPTVVVYLCVLPAVMVVREAPPLSVWNIAGFVISICAATLQLFS
ncbi:MAG: DUF1295 domain-containing protein, partial [Clostridia bacterium]|nr:DUF1295 domain-containing protein [Clostridia bacterium]